jgi:hypothetical protein
MLTGTSPHRADYQQLLADAEAGRYSHLGLYRADRFGRDTVEGLQAAKRLIEQGIKIRIASETTLRPETADGRLMFLIKMGLAQREVDVLGQRATAGQEAKMRAGGWASKAPEGYVNKEKLIKSGKYERWVEPDPQVAPALRAAWELLLTERYTLVEICEELTARGHERSGGRPWAWDDPETGNRKTAMNRLHEIFHKPFYAGWVVSETFDIPYGEVRGRWKPIITSRQFEQGVQILRRNDNNKSRRKRHFYLLRNLLRVQAPSGNLYKLYVSTPTGRSRSYSYYVSRAKSLGQTYRFSCAYIEDQIQSWLQGIAVDAEQLPVIRQVYQTEMDGVTNEDVENIQSELARRLSELHSEEARLARLHITGELTERTYKLLRAEWLEKKRNVEAQLADLEENIALHLSDLDLALILLVRLHSLYQRLKKRERRTLLQILAKRIIVSTDGEIIGQELHSPFEYLTNIRMASGPTNVSRQGSEQIRSSQPDHNPLAPPVDRIAA